MKQHVNDPDDPLTDGPNGVPRFIFEDMKRQRDEAIAALRSILPWVENERISGRYPPQVDEIVKGVCRILAKAEKREVEK